MPKLIPVADALSKPFWDAVNQRQLMLQHCDACDRLQYPPQKTCQVCGSEAGLTWKDVEGRGHIASDCPLAAQHIVQQVGEMAARDGREPRVKTPEHPIQIFARAFGLLED